ncbi:hypothetical protein [Candidatus Amarolinea dominans]|uniref:hypothetical protein n=1 Tax=Candidatus Amarolinea dominans TaxID=3140696 RepID=UPI0031CCAD0A
MPRAGSRGILIVFVGQGEQATLKRGGAHLDALNEEGVGGIIGFTACQNQLSRRPSEERPMRSKSALGKKRMTPTILSSCQA